MSFCQLASRVFGKVGAPRRVLTFLTELLIFILVLAGALGTVLLKHVDVGWGAIGLGLLVCYALIWLGLSLGSMPSWAAELPENHRQIGIVVGVAGCILMLGGTTILKQMEDDVGWMWFIVLYLIPFGLISFGLHMFFGE